MSITTMDSPTLQLKPERRQSAPVKRRVSRACDHCHRMRTRCNGQVPCSRCIELEYVCQYNREKKRRGKVPRHIQKQREAAAAAGQHNGHAAPPIVQTNAHYHRPDLVPDMGDAIWSPAHPAPVVQQFPHAKADIQNLSATGWQALPATAADFHPPATHVMIDPSLLNPADGYAHSPIHAQMPARNPELMYAVNDMHLMADPNTPVSVHAPDFPHMNYQVQYAGMRQPSPHSYGPHDAPSPQSAISSSSGPGILPCKYPVLQPLIPHLGSLMTVPMACDLLEYYFSSASSVFTEPWSPYVLGTIFRKRSFLRHHKPRNSSPALLASMLWVAAQTSEAGYLASSPSARGILCQKLWKLTIDLLKPLVHSSSPSAFMHSTSALVGQTSHDIYGVERVMGQYDMRMDGMPPTGNIDDVATYLNLAAVTSASEYKAASLRWWNAAWSLARELKLGRESPDFMRGRDLNSDSGPDASFSDSAASHMSAGTPAAALIEEGKEEQRRIWWLLYMVDRHLALAYNRPLAMLDCECEDLYQPVSDVLWQAGEFYTGSSGPRQKGLAFHSITHDVFGFFLPLMTILGDIVDLNAQKNHPRFGQRSSWEPYEAEIVRQLERYAYSLEEFKAQNGIGSAEDAAHQAHGTPDPLRNEFIHQTRKVAAYATHIMHVLQVLLHGKWDPVALLEDDNAWICSRSFLSASSSAISAAHAVEEILEVDPELSFMPYFFGMYLLQGSLILLLLADRLSTEANEGVLKACETIVRAHEAAVVTLNTEYQRSFRKVMISTLAQIKGHGHTREMTPAKKREMLSLYRWNSHGYGLAI